MRSLFKPFFSLSLFILIVSGALLISVLNDNARAQTCDILICKSAEGAGDLEFPFTADEGGEIDEFSLVGGGLCIIFGFTGAADLEITEGAVPGWQLADVECEFGGVVITDIENGINAECVGPNTGSAGCTFINVPGINENIPTLSEWGMIAAAIGLGLVGVFFAARRRLQIGA